MYNETSGARDGAKEKIKKYFTNLLDIRSDMMSYDELDDMMEENTIIHGSNMWILMMAILIASIGLNVNSTAVIIGAMLISPLMSGILTMGYSLAIQDLTMLRKAFTSFCTQVVISLITSAIYFRISPLDIPTSEMIARTNPTLWDVLIALFGGIAGGIGNTRIKKSNVIPGVAIATALMPPLCTVGYGIATLQLRFIFGAFYLFSINTLFIMLSAALVTKLLGVPSHKAIDTKRQKKVSRLIAMITVVTIIPSILFGSWTVYSTVMEQNISSYLNNEFVFSDTQMVQSSTDTLNKKISVSLVGAQVSDDVIEKLEQALDHYNLSGYTLHVTQNKITEGDHTEKVTIAVLQKTNEELQNQLNEKQSQVESLENQISSRIDCAKLSQSAAEIFKKLSDISCGIMSDGNDEYILLSGTEEKPLTDDEKETIKNWLINESGLAQAKLQLK